MKKNTQLFHRVARQSFLWWTEKQQWRNDHPEQSETPNPLRPPVVLNFQRGSLENNFAKQLSYELRYNLIDSTLLQYVADHLGYRCEWIEPLNESSKHYLKQLMYHQQHYNRDQANHAVNLNYLEAVKAALLHGSVVLKDFTALTLMNDHAGLKIKVEACLEHRIDNLLTWEQLSEKEARSTIQQYDEADQKRFKAQFGNDYDESTLFDLIINLSDIDIENAIWKIIKAMRAKNYPVFPRKEKFLR